MKFSGVYTALITPFRNGKVDGEAFAALIERQIKAGVNGIVPVGTTGESPTLDMQEHVEVVRLAVEFAAGRCEVIAGTGANSTAEAIELTQAAETLGANGTLQVCPYYNKPPQEGIFQHYKAIADSTSLPVMLYSVPGRCGVEIAVETAVQLVEACPNIVSIKEASGSLDRINQLAQALPAHISILCGDDPITLPCLAAGAHGLVSVASNLIPAEIAHLVKACLAGDFKTALELHHHYLPLLQGLMTVSVNPIPIKSALALQGHCANEFRLPLVPLNREKENQLTQLLNHFNLLG